MKEKIESLLNKLQQSHDELCVLAQELETSEIWQAEGAMQDVKQSLREAYHSLPA